MTVQLLFLALYLSINSIDVALTQPHQYVIGIGKYGLSAFSKPPKGAIFQDPDFHTSITRLTDKTVDLYLPEFMVNHYPTMELINADNSLALLGTFNFNVYSVTTHQLLNRLNPKLVHDGSDPEVRWDAIDPFIFYYLGKTIFYRYDLRDHRSVVLHDFRNDYPDATEILTDGQGEPSADGRYWAFQIRKWDNKVKLIDIVVYDKKHDSIAARYSKHWSMPGAVRWVSMSPSGKRVLVKYWGKNILGEWGVVSFAKDFQNPVSLEGATGHSDRAIDVEGNEVLLYQNNREDYITMADLKTGMATNLLKLDFSKGNFGLHFSGNSYSKYGWGLVSVYAAEETANDPGRPWLIDSIFLVELKRNPRVWRVAHTYSYYTNKGPQKKYWTSAKANINRGGTHILWTSNSYDIHGPVDVYMAILPESWWETLTDQNTLNR